MLGRVKVSYGGEVLGLVAWPCEIKFGWSRMRDMRDWLLFIFSEAAHKGTEIY